MGEHSLGNLKTFLDATPMPIANAPKANRYFDLELARRFFIFKVLLIE
mgnify:CR=1 FL=1